jgi:hypothetical protein
VEGIVFRSLGDGCQTTVRGRHKYKVRETAEAIVRVVTGSLAVPRTSLLGHHDGEGLLQPVGRTTTVARTAGDGWVRASSGAAPLLNVRGIR